MASLLSQRSLRATALRPPPEIRSTVFQSRAFSSTPSRKLTLVDVAVAGPNALLNGIHALGIPWYASLPLTAVLVRGTFVYYFASKPARKQAQTQALLLPLTNAKADVLFRSEYNKELSELQEQDQPKATRAMSFLFLKWKAKNAAMNELGKPFGAPRWTGRSLINFGMLIAFTEAIRMKCGSHDGLLSTILSPFQWAAQQMNPERFPAPSEPELKDPATMLAERLEAARSQAEAAAGTQAQSMSGTSQASEMLNTEGYDGAFQSGAATKLSPLNGQDTLSAYFDPSLATDGLAWFTNLTLPDSTFLFPGALCLTMLATMTLRPTVGKLASPNKRSDDDQTQQNKTGDTEAFQALPERTQDHIGALQNYWSGMQWTQRFGIWISGFFFVIALKLPVAILLYFIPSIALGWLQSRWLDYKYPLPQQIQKCARPMRLKVRRQWRTAG